MRARAADSGVRLAELMAALSIATDLGMGQPLESALCSCVVAMRLGEALGPRRRDAARRLLPGAAALHRLQRRHYAMAALFGDELALRHDFASRRSRPPARGAGPGHALSCARRPRARRRLRMAVVYRARPARRCPRTDEPRASPATARWRSGWLRRLGFGESLIVCWASSTSAGMARACPRS